MGWRVTWKDLSNTQQEAVRRLRLEPEGERRLVRYAGGFWTTPTMRFAKVAGRTVAPAAYDYGRHGAPEWYVSTQTVRALERGGVLERTHEHADEWRDTRRLVPE